MKISIFGAGYVGLVTGACFAEMGNDVICADIDQHKISMLNDGKSPIYEPGLEGLIQSNSKDGRLKFTTDLVNAVQDSDVLFIAVGTPSDEDGSADLKHVLQVAETIGQHMPSYRVVVTKSTVPVGTSQKVKELIERTLNTRGVAINFDVVSNPEFLKEGAAIEDCLKPSRVVIGCESDSVRLLMQRLYEPFVRNGHPILVMDIISAELTKYAANAMLATKISFMNELSRLCEEVGGDIEKIRHGIGSDPRIGYEFIYPGLGYGGSCLPKDVRALVHTGNLVDQELKILKAVADVNSHQREYFFSKIHRHFEGKLSGKVFAFWGLSFKPGTDDVREAPALHLLRLLLAQGAKVQAFDPVAERTAKAELGALDGVSYVTSREAALEGADALCVVTEWKQFREPDFAKIKKALKQPVIFDGRNLYNPQVLRDAGFDYYSIGRKNVRISAKS